MKGGVSSAHIIPITPVLTGAMNINTHPSCSRTMVPDIAFGSILDLDITMVLVVAQDPQNSTALAVAWPPGSNMVPVD